MDMTAPQNTSSSTQQNQPRHPNSSLPDAREMIVLFNFYRHRVHPFQFVLDDIDEIERSMCSLINGDTEAQQCDAHFLCLLHAIFSLGAQFSDLGPTVRVPKYQNHLKHALGLLGTFDYLWNPSKRLIQAFLILGHVLQNDMNPRAAWILGGTTIRLGLSVGLHQPESIAGSIRISPAEAQNLRLTETHEDVGQLSIAHKKALKALQALQKLAEDDIANESATREEEGQESTNIQDRAIISHQNLGDLQDPSTFEMDDWLRTFEFDSFSPLDAYNFIMSDQALPETGFQG
ncbi:hypothetical protein FALBO_12318 [Fusarium albosuccineum]|uniref:Xylanolytic transcriptional activator regulatory domain-containing protein n=1 Tax=Fusarium albosuccineum TaxID=1237068 RepID=A0A8H4L0W4_9HYPO|nr:hypothetical protein FALBO_12318 [Fusarium albosuccineum]